MRTKYLAVLALASVSLTGCGYNTIQSYDEQAAQAQQNISVQLQRSADLIPNIVATVKGFAQQALDVLTSVTAARAGQQSSMNTKYMKQMATANYQVTGALRGLMVTVEAYPQLKSDQNFLRLQDELSGTENRIAVARTDYNG